MIYLDTGCLVKLYYPEPESQRIANFIAGKPICYSSLHALEFANAFQLKLFHQSASTSQVQSASALIETDLKSGVLIQTGSNWENVFHAATALSKSYSQAFGCRSLDILHCAIAALLPIDEFMTFDERQKKLAAAMGLKLAAL